MRLHIDLAAFSPYEMAFKLSEIFARDPREKIRILTTDHTDDTDDTEKYGRIVALLAKVHLLGLHPRYQ